jgi:Enoyl-CoA hydratase/isomerase
MSGTAEDDLRYEVRDHIGYIVFNRPHARNALTFAMYERVAEICEAVNKSASVKVLVLSGAGDKAFASGTDISQFRAFKTPQDALDYEARIDRVLGTLEQTRVPTIAAIAGACTGGGGWHRGLLRYPHRRHHRALWLSHRPHAWQLSRHLQSQPARGPDRPGAGQGRNFHRASRRGARSAAHRPHQRNG